MNVGQHDYSLSHSSDGLELVLEVPALLGESVQTIRPQELVLWRPAQHPTRVPGSQLSRHHIRQPVGQTRGPVAFLRGSPGWVGEIRKGFSQELNTFSSSAILYQLFSLNKAQEPTEREGLKAHTRVLRKK